jgi:hypothetical protein
VTGMVEALPWSSVIHGLPLRFVCGAWIKQGIKPEPYTMCIPEKQPREPGAQPDPQHALWGQGRLRPVRQGKGPQKGEDDGDTIVDRHRAQEIPCSRSKLPLKTQATDGTSLVPPQPAAEHRPCAPALAA